MMDRTVPDRKPNRLIHSNSPYLLQHAFNPVDWFEWGPEAWRTAVAEDKPVLVSIGYASCHWCHVMERECFENPDIAALMNEHFVCIKVDREERPDIDQVYMEAVQAMGMNGGWPLNVFLTPDQKPFYGGTYFQPPHWSRLIGQLAQAFRQRRKEVSQSAEQMVKHLNSTALGNLNGDEATDGADFDAAFAILESKFDDDYGGLDRAPKFIMPSIWLWLLRYHYHSRNEKALQMVLRTLRKLSQGGIYDQLGGGFARYSVDARWFAPHFEKMLYDNAQLLSLYAEAYRVSPEPRFKEVVEETIDWLRREMKHPDGGFFSALDADSEGEEGRFYTWTRNELITILGDEAPLFESFYQVTSSGNWEHGRNILYRSDDTDADLSEANKARLRKCREILLAHRAKRVRPGLDDKVLTGWNAMLITGLTDAYKTFGDPVMLEEALDAARFLEERLIEGNRCFRSFRERRSDIEGFLEDYAHLIQAWVALYECTFDETWVSKAASFCAYVMEKFIDPADGFFFVSASGAEKLIARKKDLFDNVIPSPNSVMARNLLRLGTILDREEWKKQAKTMANSFRGLVRREPGYASHWGIAAFETSIPMFETVVTGPQAQPVRNQLTRGFHPFNLVMGAIQVGTLPMVRDRLSSAETWIYVCVNKTCRLPVKSVPEALQLLSSRAS